MPGRGAAGIRADISAGKIGRVAGGEVIFSLFRAAFAERTQVGAKRGNMPVSYTHLDVYKRQGLAAAAPRSPYRHLELCGIAIIMLEHFDYTTPPPACKAPGAKTFRLAP